MHCCETTVGESKKKEIEILTIPKKKNIVRLGMEMFAIMKMYSVIKLHKQ